MYLLNFANEMIVDDEAVKMMTSCPPIFEQIIPYLLSWNRGLCVNFAYHL